MMINLVCSICRKPYEGPEDEFRCPSCGGSIEPSVRFDITKMKNIIQQSKSFWDYRPFLPVDERMPCITLGEGETPLLHAQNLEKQLHCGALYIKNETVNPSGSYKDRFSTVALTLAAHFGAFAVALGSAGNAAASVCAYAARAQIPCYVFLPAGAVQERAMQIMSYGARLILVNGTIDDCIRMAYDGKRLFHWTNLATAMRFHPLGAEGYKTIAYELVRQLDFYVPDWIICPMGGGSLFSKIYRGYAEMLELGLISRIPRFAAIQAEGCAPLVKAYRNNQKASDRWDHPDTIAFAIADVDTFESATSLHIIKSTQGAAEAVNDSEILDAMRLTAQNEGVLAEPSSATTIAGLKKLLEQGVIKRSDSVVCIVSGSALRDLKLFTAGKSPIVPIEPHDENAFVSAVSAFKN